MFGGCRYFNGSTNCMSINIEKSRKLALVVDMYGCPNRCRHCWLGRLPNIPPENGADEMLVNSFRPHFEQIEYYSWLREPDFCGEYRARWERDKALSVNCEPQRFELASFWRLVRDGEYAKFLREVGVKVVQLTFFGGEETTDRYIGRKGAYSELLKATEILLQNGIAPRWQAFINAENKDEVAELPKLAEKLKLAERCRQIGQNFKFFVHAGSCDGAKAFAALFHARRRQPVFECGRQCPGYCRKANNKRQEPCPNPAEVRAEIRHNATFRPYFVWQRAKDVHRRRRPRQQSKAERHIKRISAYFSLSCSS